MENVSGSQGSDDPRLVLAVADESRRRLTDSLHLPRGFHQLLAGAIAVQVATAGYGIAAQSRVGLFVLLGGLALFLLVASLLLHWFRRLNGASLDSLASQIVLAAGPTTSVVYLGSLAAAIWAGFESAWWLLAVAAVVGGVGYAVAAHSWWRTYRQDPASHARGASPRLLAGLAALVLLGLITLLVLG